MKTYTVWYTLRGNRSGNLFVSGVTRKQVQTIEDELYWLLPGQVTKVWMEEE